MSISQALQYKVLLPLLGEKFTIVWKILNKTPALIILQEGEDDPVVHLGSQHETVKTSYATQKKIAMPWFFSCENNILLTLHGILRGNA